MKHKEVMPKQDIEHYLLVITHSFTRFYNHQEVKVVYGRSQNCRKYPEDYDNTTNGRC